MPRHPSSVQNSREFQEKGLWNPPPEMKRFVYALNNPTFAPADKSVHMRDDDYVVAFAYRGVARAYPVWIVDYYHAINDAVEDEPVIVFSWERCQTGDAWKASIEELRVTFRPQGIYNCTLSVADEQTSSTWSAFDGLGLHGPMKGKMLEKIPTYHATWGEWKALYPNTQALLPPHDPLHKDGRSGHGAEEWFGRAGMSTNFVRGTLVAPVDTRLPENHMVLAVSYGGQTRIYPIAEVKKEGGVVHDVLGGEPIVVWAGPEADSFIMGAFSRRLDGHTLTFEIGNGVFVDLQTGTSWRVDGRSVSGPLAGKILEPAEFSFLRWHAWTFFHKNNDLFFSQLGSPRGITLGVFEPIINALRQASYRVEPETEVLNLQRPNQAERGLTLHINGDRFHLFAFPGRSAAEDYNYARAHTLRSGRFVLESDPGDWWKFRDFLHTRMLPNEQIPWARLFNPNDFVALSFMELFRGLAPEPEKEELGLKDILEGLKERGYKVQAGEEMHIEGIPTGIWVTEVPRSQLRMGALNAFIARINGDPFVVYKFIDEEAARRYCQVERHAFWAGRFVIRSTPANTYYTNAGFGDRPDDEVDWSALLNDEAFIGAVRGIVGAGVR